jgi:RNA polymerase sigma-70 factor, ECF subfamily
MSLNAILAGNCQLYHQLIRPYERSIYRMSFICMESEKDAEGLARETFVRAYRDIIVFKGDLAFNAWLMHSEAKSRWGRSTSLEDLHSEETP